MKKMMILMLGMFMSLAALADGTFVTLETGQVIAVPATGKTCEFDPVYCFNGWKEDGSFPGVVFGDSIREKLAACAAEARDYPLCGRGLSLGGFPQSLPCYELVTEADD